MSGILEYSRPESDGEDLVANLVDIQTGSTVHWWPAFMTTGTMQGRECSKGMSKSETGLQNFQSG